MRVSKKRTLIALKGSIRKWERVLLGTGKELGVKNCPLCKIFNTAVNCCFGCPVMEKTGFDQCNGTPYREWVDSRRHRSQNNLTDAQTLAAKHELEFLKSLLPR